MSFVHLHTHSTYSLLDGLSPVRALAKRAREMEMPALALTDHGALYGAVDFYRACQAEGIKPILGMEAYLAPRGMRDRDPQTDRRPAHLLLLAADQTGYCNLLRIATAAQLDGFYYKPRIDHDFLAQHAAGLIATTGCSAGAVPRTLAAGDEAGARALLDFYFQVFGPERFFFELQDHGLPALDAVSRQLVDLAPYYGARCVATNDVHYLRRVDAATHDVLLCVQTGKKLDDPGRLRMASDTFYMRSADEMRALFRHVPGALENTLRIAECCDASPETDGYHLPRFDVPPEYAGAEDCLRALCARGLETRYGPAAAEPLVQERAARELDVIVRMGFADYFLIVADVCREAAQRDIWFGARGSAAGSIVAYALGISQVDPLAHDLLFERFLNPDRVSMPDIDLDFQDDRRAEMFAYLAGKYGQERVAHIITFGGLKAKAALRDAGRVLGTPLKLVNWLCSAVSNGGDLAALADTPAFKRAYAEDEQARRLIDVAAGIEGVFRNAGTHAAGVIVADRPLADLIPLHRPAGPAAEDSPIRTTAQFAMDVVESLGLLKVDFLGLRTLTTMARAGRLIKERHGVALDLQAIPTDDPALYALLTRGEVDGVFQVESDGMRRYLMGMQPRTVAHITALLALYRPGPLEFIPTYIRRMHGQEPVAYRHPALEPIFGETFGIPVYQEQLMRAAVELAGFSAAAADDLRKAIAKKQAERLQQLRDKFVRGAQARGLAAATAGEIFSDWEAFARYGFNRAHAAAYALITCKTAYLKARYPAEYMTALLQTEQGDTDKLKRYVRAAQQLGLEVLPPDVSYSQADFTISAAGAICFGLGAIKHVGATHVEAITAARDGFPFENLAQFCARVDLRRLGKRALESLIKVGALDGLGERAQLLAGVDQLLASGGSERTPAGQLQLLAADGAAAADYQLPAAPPIAASQRRTWERELMGMYVSAHPLVAQQVQVDRLAHLITANSTTLSESDGGRAVIVGALTALRSHRTKRSQEMGFATLEDLGGAIKLVIWPSLWSEVRAALELEALYVVSGRVEDAGQGVQLLVDEITPFDSALEQVDSEPPEPGGVPPASNGRGRDPAVATAAGDAPAMPDSTISGQPALLERRAAGDPPSPQHAPPTPVDLASLLLPAEEDVVERRQPIAREATVIVDASVEIPSSASNSDVVAGVPSSGGKLVTVNLPVEETQAYRHKLEYTFFKLTSATGTDRFEIIVTEGGHRFALEFPEHTTRYDPQLADTLARVTGSAANITVQDAS